MDFRIDENKLNDQVAVLNLSGSLTALTAPLLREKLNELLAENQTQIILDFTKVSFLDSSGLAVIVAGLKGAREQGGWLKLAGLSPQVRSIFEVTRLDRVFEIYQSLAAVQA